MVIRKFHELLFNLTKNISEKQFVIDLYFSNIYDCQNYWKKPLNQNFHYLNRRQKDLKL